MENESTLLSSRKFWIPVGVAIIISIFLGSFALLTVFAGGAHGKPGTTGPAIGSMLFPLAVLFLGKEGTVANILMIAVFFAQFPVYGIVAGYGNFHGKLKSCLLGIFIVHLVVYLFSTLM